MGSAEKMFKLLTSALLVCSVSSCLGGRAPKLDVVYGSHQNNNLPPPIRVSRKEETGRQDVCMTEACQTAAVNLAEAMDITADPCDDFYQFACGGWMAKNSIPEGKSKWGRFYELRDKVDQALHEIVEMESGESEAEAVKNLRRMYAGCMDTAAIEAVGLGALIDKLADPVDGWPMVLDSWNDESYDLESALGGARREFGVNWL